MALGKAARSYGWPSTSGGRHHQQHTVPFRIPQPGLPTKGFLARALLQFSPLVTSGSHPGREGLAITATPQAWGQATAGAQRRPEATGGIELQQPATGQWHKPVAVAQPRLGRHLQKSRVEISQAVGVGRGQHDTDGRHPIGISTCLQSSIHGGVSGGHRHQAQGFRPPLEAQKAWPATTRGSGMRQDEINLWPQAQRAEFRVRADAALADVALIDAVSPG